VCICKRIRLCLRAQRLDDGKASVDQANHLRHVAFGSLFTSLHPPDRLPRTYPRTVIHVGTTSVLALKGLHAAVSRYLACVRSYTLSFFFPNGGIMGNTVSATCGAEMHTSWEMSFKTHEGPLLPGLPVFITPPTKNCSLDVFLSRQCIRNHRPSPASVYRISIAVMTESFATHLGNLLINDSNWNPVNVFNNLTSGIPPSGNLQLSNFDGTSNYTYLRYHRDVADPLTEAATALDYYFRPNTFSYNARCTYPISGQYGFMNRLLFYLLMIFALVARKHPWLVAAALGTSMTYAASAAVHAFALLKAYGYTMSGLNTVASLTQDGKASDYGDLDLAGIFPILVAGCIMLTPILNWSTGIVRGNVRTVTILWGTLMFAAVVATFYNVWGRVQSLIDSDQFVTCAVDATKNCTLDHILESSTAYLSSDFYDSCNCNDTCGAVSLSQAPFRTGQNLQIYLVLDTTIKLTLSDAVLWIHFVDAFLFIFIFGHGILGLLEIKFTQAELRNKVFLIFGGKSSYSDRAGFVSEARYYIAKAIATLSFIFAIAVAIMTPAVFTISVIINEINVWGYPVSERSDAVGQWSTYVGGAFVVLAAVVQEYHAAWGHALHWLGNRVKRLIKRAFGKKNTDSGQMLTKESSKGKYSILPSVRAILVQCARPFVHARKSILHSYERVKDERRDFQRWWHDPISMSLSDPHESAYRLLPLQRSATSPGSASSLSVHSFVRPTAAVSPSVGTSISPGLLSTDRLASPQRIAGGHIHFNERDSAHDTVQRHTFERRVSGA